ncbi:hypothetical protein COEREDRAFT_79403 [Coemansia reversa NRRL 1564]|uniref:Cytochrome c oxidase-assembly factor COX23, mitochondrial n=1 Tax=Coemansia reversa (strain ATCC 12441 / NRRL 1564) TaxID=763665 RepID=A0A2G5BIK3_COERN|nr:hypothetical protein COEREDRAFT_79403 [Coemansia reversa NRRL 1564]|eukprot:PIA18848.1 hypothetical protein COEREDRAFT_79403 [Coemansia reversa NRRL 1564]
MTDTNDTSSKIRAASQSPENRRVSLREFLDKRPSRFMDPCAIEAKASYKCLDENNYKKSTCDSYFDAYKECKKLWMDERKKAKLEGRLK